MKIVLKVGKICLSSVLILSTLFANFAFGSSMVITLRGLSDGDQVAYTVTGNNLHYLNDEEVVDLVGITSCTVMTHLQGTGWTEYTKHAEHSLETGFRFLYYLPAESLIVPKRQKKRIDLAQPRHIYASKDGPGHIYMPTSLLTIGAMLTEAGCEVSFWDENIFPYSGNAETVGFNLLGAPYIPVVRQRIQELQNQDIFVGGQVINGLSKQQVESLFGSNVYNGNDQEELKNILDLDSLPSAYSLSLVSMYEKIPDDIMREYLSREFSLFVSQGCKFSCNFCAAVRTQKDPATRKTTKVTELYRDMDVIETDLKYLFSRAETLEIQKLEIYMSNLDVFQTPSLLGEFAEMVLRVREQYPLIDLEMRGLATIHSFLECVEKYPGVVRSLRKAGYTTTGFGIDGGTPEVWKKIGKGHNYAVKEADDWKAIEALRISKEDFDIIPEILMVFGHKGIDTTQSLQAAYDFTMDMVKQYNAVPRPHVAKNLVPGNDHWLNPANATDVSMFIENPWLFQALDFCALATHYTHGDDAEFVAMVNHYYQKICDIPGNTTHPIFPIRFEGVVTEKDVQEMLLANLNKFDR